MVDMHPSHTHLIAQQIQAERLRQAEAHRRVVAYRAANGSRPTLRGRVGDTLVGAGHRLTAIGDRILATAAPPPAARC